jgi:hypothetical protein
MSSWIGSGIYSTVITREIVCAEYCEECTTSCDKIWETDFHTDDRGNVDQSVTCDKCLHSFYFKEEA